MAKRSVTLFIIVFLFTYCLSVPLGRAGDGDGPAQKGIAGFQARSVKVGDIDVSYRAIGKGFPLVFITGYSATMDMWDPKVIEALSARYQVIIFDNRGINGTTASDRPFTIGLFAEDTKGLMDALNIKKAHVLGWSMGTFIATELALKYPERVEKLILYAGNCGWKDAEVVQARPEVNKALTDLSGTNEERGKRLISILFPKKYLDDHPDFLKNAPRPREQPSRETLKRQGDAIAAWQGTCDRLGSIRQPTLVITGTEDVVIPPANSLRMASKIPDSWLIRLPGGHSNIYQYPETFSRCLLTFLEAEKE